MVRNVFKTFYALFLTFSIEAVWADSCPSDVKSYLTQQGRTELLNDCFLCGGSYGFKHYNKTSGFNKLAIIVSSHNISTLKEDLEIKDILSKNNWEILHFGSGRLFAELFYDKVIGYLESGSCRKQILFYFVDQDTSRLKDPDKRLPEEGFPKEVLYSRGYEFEHDDDAMLPFASVLKSFLNYKKANCSAENQVKTQVAYIDFTAGNYITRVLNRSFSNESSCNVAISTGRTGKIASYSNNHDAPEDVTNWLRRRGFTTTIGYSRLSDALQILIGIGSGNPLSISPGEAGLKLSTFFSGQAPGLDLGVLVHSMIQRKFDGFNEIKGVQTDVSSNFVDNRTLAQELSEIEWKDLPLSSYKALVESFGEIYQFRTTSAESLAIQWSFYKDTSFQQNWTNLVSNSARFQEIKEIILKLEQLVINTRSRNRVSFLDYIHDLSSDLTGHEDNPTKDISLIMSSIENLNAELQALDFNQGKYRSIRQVFRSFIRFTYDLPQDPKMRALMYAYFKRFNYQRNLKETFTEFFETSTQFPNDHKPTPIENLKDSTFLNQSGQKFSFFHNTYTLVSYVYSDANAWAAYFPFHRKLNQKLFVNRAGNQRKIYPKCEIMLNMLSGYIHGYYPASLGGYNKQELIDYLQSGGGYDFCEWIDNQERAKMAQVFEIDSDGKYRIKSSVVSYNADEEFLSWTETNSKEFPNGFVGAEDFVLTPAIRQEVDILRQKISMARMFLFVDSIMKARSGSDANARACADFSIK